jgi:flagellar hook-associated protein 2
VSTPITFSGFNQIDFNQVLTALMAQASVPLTSLQTRQKALETQITRFDTLASRVSSLRSASGDLADSTGISTLSGTSSDETALTVSTDTSATAAHYDVVVNELARAQVTASTSVSPDINTTVVASGGTLTIGGVAVAITGDVTIQQLANTINNTANIGVHAAVVRTAPGSYRLVLTSLESGAANAFTITDGLTGGAPGYEIEFGDFDNDNISGDSPEDNSVNASDAEILINNIEATSTTNTFEDIVPGLTLTVHKKSATVHLVDVGPDSSELQGKVEDFIAAYNSMIAFANEQRTSAGSGDAASIGHDPLLRQLRNALRSELLGAHGSETVTRLAEVGIEFTQAGTLKLNPTLFHEAVEENGDAVRSLFAGTGGVFPAVETLLDEYSGGSGFISSIKDRLNSQIDSMDRQIENMQARLAIERVTLQRQFTEADTLMSRLRNQSGSLSNLGSSLGSF